LYNTVRRIKLRETSYLNNYHFVVFVKITTFFS